MRRRLHWFLLITSLALVFAADERSAEAGDKYALLVGVRDYDKNELRDLPYSETDVEELAKIFRAAGYRQENLVVMTQSRGGKEGRFLPLKKNILTELKLLLAKRDEGDSIVVVLAGHGVQFQNEKTAFFCPADARVGEQETLIPLNEVYETLNACSAGFRLLLVDACRNDPLSDNSRSRERVDLASVTRPQLIEPPGGVAAFFSCSAGERAFEHKDLRHGVFFHFVIEGLQGKADLDRDREITLPELQQFVAKRVPDFVRAEYGVLQTPDLRGTTRGLTPLVTLDSVRRRNLSESGLRISGQGVASRQVVQKAVELLETKHYSKRKVDDAVAAEWMKNVFASLDPGRLYFLQGDLDRFLRMASEIDDKARLGDIGFMWEILEAYIDRRIERLAWVDELAEYPIDFSIDEYYTSYDERMMWPRDNEEARDRLRKRFKNSALGLRATGDTEQEALYKTARAYRRQLLNGTHVLDDEGLLSIALSSLGNVYDRSTTYFSAKQIEDFMIDQRRQLEGIGASLRMIDGNVLVAAVVPGSPTDKDGRIQVGDRILGAGSSETSIQDFDGLKLPDVVRIIRGPKKTKIVLHVLPKEKTEAVYYELMRDKLDLQRAYEKVYSEPRRSDQKNVKIGYIVLPKLYGGFSLRDSDAASRGDLSSRQDLAKILSGFNRDEIDVAVLDLRHNPGGSLREAVEIPGLFIETGPVLNIFSRDGSSSSMSPEETKPVWHKPLIILTSRYTGAGPEIIAAALQDYGRAIVVGDDQTSGMASVQTVIDVGQSLVSGNNAPRLGAVKISFQMFFMPSGRSTLDIGVQPNIVLPSFTTAAGQSTTSSPSLLRDIEPADRLAYVPHAYTNPTLIEELKKYSAQRASVVPEFVTYQDEIQEYTKQLSAQTPLEAKQYFQWYSSRLSPKFRYLKGDELADRDAYLNEVIAIALDLAPLGDWQQNFDAGREALKAGRHAEAVTQFTSAIEADDRHTEAFALRARAYAASGNWTSAIADANAAGLSGVPVKASSKTILKVGNDAVANLAVGDRVLVSSTNESWLWAHLPAKPDTKGWIRSNKASVVLPTE